MKLIFFDEAKNDPDFPHYFVGAVCIDETALETVEAKINAIAEKAFGTSRLSSDTEFHAAEIFHRKKNFKEWTDFDARVALLADFIDILSMDEVQLIRVQINCAKLYAGQSAEDIAFMFLCERANGSFAGRRPWGC